MADLSLISLKGVKCTERNIFTNRKSVTFYIRNTIHENTALFAEKAHYFCYTKLLKTINQVLLLERSEFENKYIHGRIIEKD